MTILLTALFACAPAGDATKGVGAAQAGAEGPASLPQVTLGPTTEGAVALANLDAQTDAALDAFTRNPQLMTGQQALGLLLSRVQFTGRFADFDGALELSEEALERWGHRPEAWLMAAQSLSAVHRFEEAHDALDEAEALGAVSTRPPRGTYWLAQGRNLGAVLEGREADYAARASFESRTGLAGALAALGQFERADALYREALEGYSDVSPLPLAWVFFQRGVMWGEMAERPDLAESLYRRAVQLLPGYVVANVHLAELEVGGPNEAAAIDRLVALLPFTDDPEPAGKLAGYLAATSPPSSARYRASATDGYGALLAKHREAFLDHASEFFTGNGMDPTRGLGLAMENVTLRQNARAYLVALGAAQAADQELILCQLVDEARGIEGVNRNLESEVELLAARCR